MTGEPSGVHQTIAEVFGCTDKADYLRTKAALLAALRRARPAYFILEGGRRRSLEHMARREGRTVDEMLEDMALVDFVIMRSFAECTREEVLAALAACDLADWEKAVVGKLIEQNVP